MFAVIGEKALGFGVLKNRTVALICGKVICKFFGVPLCHIQVVHCELYLWHSNHARTRFLFADLPLNVVKNARNTQSIPVLFA